MNCSDSYLRGIAQVGVDYEGVRGAAGAAAPSATAARLAGRRHPDGGKRDEGT